MHFNMCAKCWVFMSMPHCVNWMIPQSEMNDPLEWNDTLNDPQSEMKTLNDPLDDVWGEIQSGAIITRSFITWYYLHHCSNWGRTYRQVSNTRRTKSQHLKDSHAVFGESLEARCFVENKDVHVVGAAPTGDAPTTSEWLTSLLPKVRLILHVLRYIKMCTHKRHPIPHPHRQAMGCLLWGFWWKLTA